MLFQNLKAIGEELSEICVLFCNYIYIFIYIDVAVCLCSQFMLIETISELVLGDRNVSTEGHY
jgi:hypothetical protein